MLRSSRVLLMSPAEIPHPCTDAAEGCAGIAWSGRNNSCWWLDGPQTAALALAPPLQPGSGAELHSFDCV